MSTIRWFEDITCWQKARELNQKIYQMSLSEKVKRDFGFCDQIRRSSVSIMSNIAEGYERQSDKEFSRFLFIARGSAGEVRSLLYVALDLDYISSQEFESLSESTIEISKMIFGLISYLDKNMNPSNVKSSV